MKRIIIAFFRKVYFFLLNRRRNILIGKNTKVDIGTKFQILNNVNGNIRCGNNCFLRSSKKGYHSAMPFNTTLLVDKDNAQIEIGDNCRINGAYIHAWKSIKIGNNCLIASGVNIIDSNGHILFSQNRTKGQDDPKEIVIGNNVWIGLNSIILKGTQIGDNSVVAAGCVVKGNFPENVLIQGNPAVVVKNLRI